MEQIWFVNAWMCECVDVPIRVCFDAWVCGCVHLGLRGFAISLFCGRRGRRLCGCLLVLLFGCIEECMRRCVRVSVCECVFVHSYIFHIYLFAVAIATFLCLSIVQNFGLYFNCRIIWFSFLLCFIIVLMLVAGCFWLCVTLLLHGTTFPIHLCACESLAASFCVLYTCFCARNPGACELFQWILLCVPFDVLLWSFESRRGESAHPEIHKSSKHKTSTFHSRKPTL